MTEPITPEQRACTLVFTVSGVWAGSAHGLVGALAGGLVTFLFCAALIVIGRRM